MVSTADRTAAETFEQLRPLLFGIAYRMLGSVADAEDIVQEAFLRYHRALASSPAVESPKAFLSAVVTRLAIDQLRSARARREAYIGPWLPEPVLTDPVAPGPGGEGHGHCHRCQSPDCSKHCGSPPHTRSVSTMRMDAGRSLRARFGRKSRPGR